MASEELRRLPTTYYSRDSGVGLALDNCCKGRARRVADIGLGTVLSLPTASRETCFGSMRLTLGSR